MKEPKDKRTKAYKEWKKAFDEKNTVGLGDIVETITEKTGIKKLFENNEDCGCSERKQKFNKKRFRFTPVRCFTEDMYNAWGDFLQSSEYKRGLITADQQRQILFPIYRHLFARNILSEKHIKRGKILNCCWEGYAEEINKVFNEYQ